MNRIIVLHQPTARQSMQRQLEDLFRRQWGHPQPAVVRRADGLWQPQVDVYEVDDAYVVLVELAGMRDSEIELTVMEDVLVIAGHRPELHHDGTLRFHQLEINEGPFKTAVMMPGPIADEGITATYDDGLLTIMLPKRRVQTRRIEVATRQ